MTGLSVVGIFHTWSVWESVCLSRHLEFTSGIFTLRQEGHPQKMGSGRRILASNTLEKQLQRNPGSCTKYRPLALRVEVKPSYLGLNKKAQQ